MRGKTIKFTKKKKKMSLTHKQEKKVQANY